jgi:hypothetical protein
VTDWAQLRHAYGAAQDVPSLLEQAVPDAANPVWDELWSRLCHQGTVYSASFAALPALTDLARRWSPTDRISALVLAAAIVASTDRARDADDPYVSHAGEIAELISLTEQALHDTGLRDYPVTYVYLLQALLGLEGDQLWGQALDGINDEEFEVSCPSCDVENYVVFGRYGYFSTLESLYINEPDPVGVPLLPANEQELGPLARRLYARAMADGHPDIANKLTYVFGTAHCAGCGQLFRVDQAVATYWSA